ncbi:MAG: NUDIX hydrolase [Pirellulales bacterium]|nr:NUDIX hydrolase [Pirellulales bacterium]
MNRNEPRRVLAEGKYVRLVAAGRWEWAERVNTSGAVVIVPVTADRRLVLIEQYRVPLGAPVIELPAGLVGDGPDFVGERLIDAARRELLEETGYDSDRWQYLVEGPSTPGLASEHYTMFLAAEARQSGEGGGDEFEDILVHSRPLEGIETWLNARRREGKPVDPKVHLGIFYAREYFQKDEGGGG